MFHWKRSYPLILRCRCDGLSLRTFEFRRVKSIGDRDAPLECKGLRSSGFSHATCSPPVPLGNRRRRDVSSLLLRGLPRSRAATLIGPFFRFITRLIACERLCTGIRRSQTETEATKARVSFPGRVPFPFDAPRDTRRRQRSDDLESRRRRCEKSRNASRGQASFHPVRRFFFSLLSPLGEVGNGRSTS